MTLYRCWACRGAGEVHDCQPGRFPGGADCGQVPCHYCLETGETPWRDFDAYWYRDVTGVGTARDPVYWRYAEVGTLPAG